MFEISGISIILLIAGIVELFKKLNLHGNILILVSVLVGAVFGTLYKLYLMFPDIQSWLEVGIFAIAFGLGAAGLYDISKNFFSTNKPTDEKPE
jgi:uncharacterized membrane protein HdeD (DUF308 family)